MIYAIIAVGIIAIWIFLFCMCRAAAKEMPEQEEAGDE